MRLWTQGLNRAFIVVISNAISYAIDKYINFTYWMVAKKAKDQLYSSFLKNLTTEKNNCLDEVKAFIQGIGSKSLFSSRPGS